MADNARASLDSLSLSAAEGQGGEDVWVDILPLVQRASEGGLARTGAARAMRAARGG